MAQVAVNRPQTLISPIIFRRLATKFDFMRVRQSLPLARAQLLR